MASFGCGNASRCPSLRCNGLPRIYETESQWLPDNHPLYRPIVLWDRSLDDRPEYNQRESPLDLRYFIGLSLYLVIFLAICLR
jgi:hypothetical protein